MADNKIIHSSKSFFKKNSTEKPQASLLPVLFSPDGKWILAWKIQIEENRQTRGIVLCDSDSLKEKQEICPPVPTTDVLLAERAAFTPNGRNLLVFDQRNGSGTLTCRKMPSLEVLWQHVEKKEYASLEMLIPSPKDDVVLLVSRDFLGGDWNRGRAVLTTISSRTGVVLSSLDTEFVFPGN